MIFLVCRLYALCFETFPLLVFTRIIPEADISFYVSVRFSFYFQSYKVRSSNIHFASVNFAYLSLYIHRQTADSASNLLKLGECVFIYVAKMNLELFFHLVSSKVCK